MSSKDEVSSKIFYDPAGYGNIKQTYQEAKKKDPTIKLQDVQAWFAKNRSQKIMIKGYNSYMADGPKEEYQADLFFINDLDEQKYRIGLLMIDIFTKRMIVVPIADKSLGTVLAGMMECIQKLGGYPGVIYSDEEPAITSQGVVDFMAEKGTRVITTRTHAGVAERAIRTFKNMLYSRIDSSEKESPQWIDFIFQILLTYNNKNVH